MKSTLADKLRCPITGNSLLAFDFDNLVAGQEIETGILCESSGQYFYPIINFVPLMLVFPTEMSSSFARKHNIHIENIRKDNLKFRQARLPDLKPEKGERDIQKTFTEEWDSVDDADFTFRYSPEQNIRLQREVWLKSLSNENITGIRQILDVGCGGFGAESVALTHLNKNCEVYGIDLNLSLIKNGAKIRDTPRAHFVVCSLFHIPFAKESCDLVFSQGVLHHTFSTEEAIKSVEKYVRESGTLFIWLYAVEDPLRGVGFQKWKGFLVYLMLMRFLRPIMAQSPYVIRVSVVYMLALYNHMRFKMTQTRPLEWTFKNTVHGVYDMITPRYAHDHTFNEMIEFVENLGFDVVIASPQAYRREMGWPIHGIGICGERRIHA